MLNINMRGETEMRKSVLVVLVLIHIGVYGCSSKDRVYEGMYEGLKMGKELQEPTDEQIATSDEELPDYQRYKKERGEILEKKK